MKDQTKRGTGGRKPPDDPEQSKRFKKTARELGAHESGKSFQQAVTNVVKSLPPLKRKKAVS